MRFAVAALLCVASAEARVSTLWSKAEDVKRGYEDSVTSPEPHTYVPTADLPTTFSWGDVNGTNYLTKNLNQHIPQYCGSCWAHAAVSALADRIKIARKAKGIEIALSVQHIMNCGYAGSCDGGSTGIAYMWIKRHKDGVVFDTCQPYLACSSEKSDQTEGFCAHVDTTCSAMNTCRTCSTFTASGGVCRGVSHFPNATIAEHGTIIGEEAMMKEIYARGPIGCGIYAPAILDYHGGIASGKCKGADHAISVVGWGETNGEKYWVVRNSWGEYWGERGFFKVSRGSGEDLCLEDSCSWATPKTWTEKNYPCDEDGGNCQEAAHYVDPSTNGVAFGKQL